MLSNRAKDRTLSPRELAQALGVSESSMKRWIDAGRVPARLTTGGHRRIELLPALRFLRDSGRQVAKPDLLGLPPLVAPGLAEPEALDERIFELLNTGQDCELSELLLAALVIGRVQPAALFDGPVRAAMARIGHLWEAGLQGIHVEHRATQVLLRVLDPIDSLFEPPADGPIAVGGSIDGDPSLLPTRLAATVLFAEGFRSVNLGADTPAPAFLDAAEQIGARLVWVSVSYVREPARQSQALARLHGQLAERGVACILGGRDLERLQLPEGARVGRSMQELAAMARELVPA